MAEKKRLDAELTALLNETQAEIRQGQAEFARMFEEHRARRLNK